MFWLSFLSLLSFLSFLSPTFIVSPAVPVLLTETHNQSILDILLKIPSPPVLVCQFCPRDVLTRCRKWQWQLFRHLNNIFLYFQFCVHSVSTLARFNIMWQNMKKKTVLISASFNYALSPLLKVGWGGLTPKLVCLRRCMSCQLTRHVTLSRDPSPAHHLQISNKSKYMDCSYKITQYVKGYLLSGAKDRKSCIIYFLSCAGSRLYPLLCLSQNLETLIYGDSIALNRSRNTNKNT